MMNSLPVAADISFCVALIPGPPLYDQLASASVAITKSFQNRNVIDNKRYPAHISLHLGGVARSEVAALTNSLAEHVRVCLGGPVHATRLYTGFRGFIGVGVDASASLNGLVKEVRNACNLVQERTPVVRPHLIERWSRLPAEQRMQVLKFGTYKANNANDLHLSVAEVDEEDQDEALAIADKHLTLPQDVKIHKIELIDVGHHNESWTVLASWSP